MGLLHKRTPEQEESELYGERASVSKAGQPSNSKRAGVSSGDEQSSSIEYLYDKRLVWQGAV